MEFMLNDLFHLTDVEIANSKIELNMTAGRNAEKFIDRWLRSDETTKGKRHYRLFILAVVWRKKELSSRTNSLQLHSAFLGRVAFYFCGQNSRDQTS